jgi:hypothetical protein
MPKKIINEIITFSNFRNQKAKDYYNRQIYEFRVELLFSMEASQ